MSAHATLPGRHRRSVEGAPGGTRTRGRGRAGWIVPLVLAVLYGFYAQNIERGGATITAGQAVLGVVSGVVFGVLCFLLWRYRGRLPREPRAVAFGSLAGLAVGWLYSLSGNSVLTVAVVSLIVGAGVACAAFYVFYTHE
ncbi:hypothetical protein ACIRD2_17350 [Streptomyces sp. NPDC093595]|uniref:hypothetical protein n=1 Tax=Streptomyces sp. NPDC093595 TaxID=3366045 RepID=UPI00382EA631